jgi:hypothetical protein
VKDPKDPKDPMKNPMGFDERGKLINLVSRIN